MTATRPVKILSEVLFFMGVTLTTVCFLDTWRQPFFINTHYKALKLCLCVIIPAVLVLFNYWAEKSFNFISQASIVISCLFVIGYAVDQFTIKWITCFGSFVVIYHLAYGLVSMCTVFATCVIIKHFTKNKLNDFDTLYYNFFTGFAVMGGFIFILIYFIIRDYGAVNAPVNLIPFNGEIKTAIIGKSKYTIIRSVGNVLFYSAISLTFMRFFKKNRVFWGFIIPITASVFCEAFEYFTACGEADIDDVIMNLVGILLGVAVYKLFIEKLLLSRE
ncbi:MAG: VanZ family protein [Eubacterium sp.]